MNPGQNRAQRMGTEPIPRLLLEFSIPVMTGMIVQAVYSIINRAFIGNVPEAATLGMAAITVGMPIMLVSMAFGMLIGFGGSAALSLYLGQKNQEKAEQVLGNAFTLTVGLGLVVTVLGIVFLDPLLKMLGATDEVMPYAREYNLIILISTIPMMVGFGLNNFIRAEGNPKTSMINMVLSAGVNVVFDFLFIVVFHWGVAGAALGTLCAQSFTAFLVLRYFFTKRSHVRFSARALKIDWAIVGKMVAIGSSSFLMQIGASLVQFVLNNQLMVHGGDKALAAWGIITTLMMFFSFFVFGLNGGSQPLIGYNYGARNFLRVRTTAKWAILAATVIVTASWALIEIFAGFFVGMFSGQDQGLHDMATRGLRFVALMMPIIGFQIIASGYFNAVGKPLHAMFLALGRQVLFLLPLTWIFPVFWGLDGIFWATPAADTLAGVVAFVFFFREFRQLKRKHADEPVPAPTPPAPGPEVNENR
jgi:putative MATE family efflux protein